MSNGDTLNSIEAILTGAEEIPGNVTNKLLLMALRLQYQRSVLEDARIARIEARLADHDLKIASHTLCIEDNEGEINRLRTRSNWSDGFLGLATAIGTAIGLISK